jgi:tetratricopeptide (TPR) repeat protein
VSEVIALKPKADEALFYKNKANTLKELGKFKQAENYYRMAIRQSPNDGECYLNISSIKTFHTSGDGDIKNMFIALGNSSSESNKALLHFALGKAFDDCKEYDKAFFHYSEANKIQGNITPPKQYYLIDDITKSQEKFFFTNTFFKKKAKYGNDSTMPFFILGMERSGIKLVDSIMRNHSEVSSGGGINYLQKCASKMIEENRTGVGYPACLENISKQEINLITTEYLSILQTFCDKPTIKHVTNTSSSSFKHLGLIRLCFPNSKIIHCRRHPVDTCLSMFFNRFDTGYEYSYILENLVVFYKKYHKLMHMWQTVMPGFIHNVRYDDIIKNTEKTTNSLLKFCDLELEDTFLNIKPIKPRKKAKWRKYEEYIGRITETLEQEIKSYMEDVTTT